MFTAKIQNMGKWLKNAGLFVLLSLEAMYVGKESGQVQ